MKITVDRCAECGRFHQPTGIKASSADIARVKKITDAMALLQKKNQAWWDEMLKKYKLPKGYAYNIDYNVREFVASISEVHPRG